MFIEDLEEELADRQALRPDSDMSNDDEVTILRKRIEELQHLLDDPERKKNINEIYLPVFDPDEDQINIEEWCRQVEALVNFRGCPEFIAIMKALSSLKGRAKDWADANTHRLETWEDIRRELVAQFQTRHIVNVNRFRDYTSDHAETFGEFVNNAWRLFSRISPGAPTDLIIEAVISGVRPRAYQYQLLRSLPETQAGLITALGTYQKIPVNVTKADFHAWNSQRQIRCGFCGRFGHVAKFCRARRATHRNISWHQGCQGQVSKRY